MWNNGLRHCRCNSSVCAIVVWVCPAIALASTRPIFKDWKAVYQELNDGRDPQWATQAEAEKWLSDHVREVEPVVLEVLRGERPDVPWTAGLTTARVVVTPAIAAVASDRLKEALARNPQLVVGVHSSDSYLITVIQVLERARYVPALPLVHRLCSIDGQDSLTMEHCLAFMRKIGDESSIAIMQTLRRRGLDETTQRRLSVAEKVITTRLDGRDIAVDAQSQLRAVTRAWREAIETKNYDAFLGTQPFGGEGMDKRDFYDEILREPQMPAILDALKKVGGQEEFEVDRDKLEASLVVDGRYKFDYVLEADGWKIGGPMQIAP